MKTPEQEAKEINIYEKYHLSTEGYYFKYRHDKYDHNVIRVSLYNTLGEKIDDVRVSEGNGQQEKSQHDVINYFEARLFMNEIA